MRFTLEIELGNDAMRTAADIRRALYKLGSPLRSNIQSPVRDGDGAKIMDDNGNSVGSWAVID